MNIRHHSPKPAIAFSLGMLMKSILLCTITFVSFQVFAGDGPTNIGSVNIGMNKADYVAVLGIKPVDCDTFKDRNKIFKSEKEYLNSEKKSLCHDFRTKPTGMIENIQLENIVYDVIVANYESSKFVDNIGHSSQAIFLKDRLIRLEIYSPKVNIETLVTKYGAPKIADSRKIQICKNKMGNEFQNNEGNLDAIWTNGGVSSIFRTSVTRPYKTCTDGSVMQYYILEERKELESIEAAINKFREAISKKTANESQF